MRRVSQKKEKNCHLGPLCSASRLPCPDSPAFLLSFHRYVRFSPPVAGFLPQGSPNPLRTTRTGRASVQADAFKQKSMINILLNIYF